jgi:hypothetical protein
LADAGEINFEAAESETFECEALALGLESGN